MYWNNYRWKINWYISCMTTILTSLILKRMIWQKNVWIVCTVMSFFPLNSRQTRTTNRTAIHMDFIYLPIIMSIWIVLSIVCWWLLYLSTSLFSISIDPLQCCIVTRVFSEKNKQEFREAILALDWACSIPDTQNSFSHFHPVLMSLQEGRSKLCELALNLC